jgi:transposase
VFRFDERLKVYLHRDPVDFRMGINGLSLLVEQAMGLNPMDAALYVFGNRNRDRIKLLGWDGNGFWLFMKRLEADRFAWPREAAVITLNVDQLHWLLQGIDLTAIHMHAPRHYLRVG